MTEPFTVQVTPYGALDRRLEAVVVVGCDTLASLAASTVTRPRRERRHTMTLPLRGATVPGVEFLERFLVHVWPTCWPCDVACVVPSVPCGLLRGPYRTAEQRQSQGLFPSVQSHGALLMGLPARSFSTANK